MISATILTKFVAVVAFLWLLNLLSCAGDADAVPNPSLDEVQGIYLGYLKIGPDSFPDIEVVLKLHSPTEMRISSSSDLISPFACNLENDSGIVQQSDDGRPWFLSVNMTELPPRMSLVYTNEDKYFLGVRLY